MYVGIFLGVEVDQNGLDSNVGEDSDSLGTNKTSKTSITPPAKEKRKPFFKKVSGDTWAMKMNGNFFLLPKFLEFFNLWKRLNAV
jgi:hypothetical protein